MQRIMDQSDGQDLDPMKVQRYFKKNQWEAPDGGPPGHDYSRNVQN